MRAIERRMAAIGRSVDPRPAGAFLAYARAVVAYGGGESTVEAVVGLAWWLESGRRTPCGLD